MFIKRFSAPIPQQNYLRLSSAFLFIGLSACGGGTGESAQSVETPEPPEVGMALGGVPETSIPFVTIEETAESDIPPSLSQVRLVAAYPWVNLFGTDTNNLNTNVTSNSGLQGFEGTELPIQVFVDSLPAGVSVDYVWQQVDTGLPVSPIRIETPDRVNIQLPVVPGRQENFEYALTLTTDSGDTRTLKFQPNVSARFSCPGCSAMDADRLRQFEQISLKDLGIAGAEDVEFVNEQQAYVASSADNSIHLIDLSTRTVIGSYRFDQPPVSVGWDGTSQRLYALTNQYAVVIDIENNASRQIDFDGLPIELSVDHGRGVFIKTLINIEDNPIWIPEGSSRIRVHERAGLFYADKEGNVVDLTYDPIIPSGQAAAKWGQVNWYFDGQESVIYYIDPSLIRRFTLDSTGSLQLDSERSLLENPLVNPNEPEAVSFQVISNVEFTEQHLILAGGTHANRSGPGDTKIVLLPKNQLGGIHSVISVQPSPNAHRVERLSALTVSEDQRLIAYAFGQLGVSRMTYRVTDLVSRTHYVDVFLAECDSRFGKNKILFAPDSHSLLGYTACPNRLHDGPFFNVVPLPDAVR